MLSFITENVWKPWTYSDVREYEKHGSQRDKIHYNSLYNSRIILSEKNVFQCSIRVNSEKYKNFYLIAIARKMFYFSIYIPQLDIIKKHSNDEFIKKCISKTRFINNFIYKSTTSPSLDDDIVYVGGNTLMVKVKAQIEDFLFPKRGEISNELIIQQYKELNNIYANVVGEFEKICSLIETYNNKLNQQIEKEQEAIKRMLIRKGVRIAASVGVAALTGIYVDFDTILGFEDLADVADVIDTANFSFDADIDYIDWETEPDLLLSENDNHSNISFGSRYDHINSIYDPEISSAEDKLISDLDRIREEGPYPWEKTEQTLERDKQNIEYLNSCKADALRQADIDQAKQDYWNNITDYAKERMSKKIHG